MGPLLVRSLNVAFNRELFHPTSRFAQVLRTPRSDRSHVATLHSCGRFGWNDAARKRIASVSVVPSGSRNRVTGRHEPHDFDTRRVSQSFVNH